ncbi:replication stress response regulator SDE2 isoform X2 [Esox lucius]|uniref:Replication stress response regulator SDE2 n=1 Tax=Esox lucius TaxID=8010 RepID=A0A3P8Z6I6_ESOLU|nr:replication stress response regulator SDE2 isoform X2 [Esox lucius]
MEVFVSGPLLQFSVISFSSGASVRDLIHLCTNEKGFPSTDLYVKNNGRISSLDDKLQAGAVYRLEPRLCGGKGGFGSMLRALGAQIEKTTNREACRDLSGRRLRDVNHEKEMAEWLKKQADREAEKEQKRLERLERKLAEPKHQFTDPNYERQCHDLSERLEDSVLKGMQASSSGLVKVDEAPKRKKQIQGQRKSKKKCLWTGVGGLDDLDSSEEEGASDSEDSLSTSVSGTVVSSSPMKRATSAHYSASQSIAKPAPTTEAPSTSSKTSSPESPAGMQTQSQAVAAASSGSREQEVVPTEETSTKSESLSIAQSNTNRATQEGGPCDLQAVHSAKELESLGLDKLKAELIARGMKCGGTLSERAARLYSSKGISVEDIDPALLAKHRKGK